jgi:phosphate starvation-inducible PhoH-like protein
MSEYTRNIQALNEQQKNWFRKLDHYPIHILEGPAGVGKTYIATAEGCSRLDKGIVEKIIFLRPHVTSEDFGFLPGSLEDKMDPFMLPLVDVAVQRLSGKRYAKYVAEKKIEIAALAYLRGRTFHNSWVIFDEAQNSTPSQMKMVLTRLGNNTKLIITGDSSQSDLPGKNGLDWVKDKLSECPIVHVTQFTTEQVVRSETVKELLKYLGD